MKYFWTRYLANYPDVLLYMLQDTEYKLGRYLSWYHRTDDFRKVMKRRRLDVTQKVKLLRLVLWLIWLIMVIILAVCVYVSVFSNSYIWGLYGIVSVLVLPFVMAYGIILPLSLGQLLIQIPKEKKMIAQAKVILKNHKAKKIAVAGSYGKTTAKEILSTILAEGLKVASTPGNMNTAIGISRFARKLKGNEDVLIIELGEEKLGDIEKLCELSSPNMGIITGINEAHLQSFKNLDNTVKTIFSLVDYLGDKPVYKNKGNNLVLKNTDKDDKYLYDSKGVEDWVVSDIKTSIHGTHFVAKSGSKIVHSKTGLIGRQTIGVTVACIAIADHLGLTEKQITEGLSKVTPFEHRMEPKKLHGAWIIDDTYNGNSDGVRSGLAFLASIDAKRRIYVTPGLVEQGDKTRQVHQAIGNLAGKSADLIVLMNNSVTDYIVSGIHKSGYKGKITIVDDPLEFYTNMEHFVAAGDVVLMQNDWTDNYAQAGILKI